MTIRSRMHPMGGGTEVVKLTVNTTPSSANVTLSASGFTQSGKTITVTRGTTVYYTVSATNYVTQSGSLVVNSTQTLNISLTYKPYYEGQIIREYNGDTTTTVNLLVTGYYDVYLIGGGGGGAFCFYIDYSGNIQAGGGSGAGFIGRLRLNTGTYNIKCGGKGWTDYGSDVGQHTGTSGGESYIKYSSGTNIITCYGGHYGSVNGYGVLEVGSGGTNSINISPTSTSLNTSGNAGTFGFNVHGDAGASVWNGYGNGGASDTQPANGYFKIVFISL